MQYNPEEINFPPGDKQDGLAEVVKPLASHDMPALSLTQTDFRQKPTLNTEKVVDATYVPELPYPEAQAIPPLEQVDA